MKTVIFMTFLMLMFTGCGEDASKASKNLDSSVTPQPSVKDESLQPPKPPAI